MSRHSFSHFDRPREGLKVKSAILLLSDLHFGTSADEEGAIVPAAIREQNGSGFYLALKVFSKFGADLLYAHSKEIILGLKQGLKKALSQLETECGYERSDFDLYMIAGDLGTVGTKSCYEFLRQYLWSDGKAVLGVNKGLDICRHSDPRDKVMLVPGNHDKYFANNLSALLNIFKPPVIPNQGESSYIYKELYGQEFLFVSIDSNTYASWFMPPDLLQNIAAGEITQNLKNKLLSDLNNLSRGKVIQGIYVENFEKAFKVLLLHHPLKILHQKRWLASGGCRNILSLARRFIAHNCRDVERLVGVVRKFRFDLIVHGHMHCTDSYRVNGGIKVLQLSTTTQCRICTQDNSFYVLRFYENGEVWAERWEWSWADSVFYPQWWQLVRIK